jgi:hypothetical protein
MCRRVHLLSKEVRASEPEGLLAFPDLVLGHRLPPLVGDRPTRDHTDAFNRDQAGSVPKIAAAWSRR